jgi:hypothetical protein
MLKLNNNYYFLYILFFIVFSPLSASFINDDNFSSKVQIRIESTHTIIKSLEDQINWLPDEVTRGADGTKEDMRKRIKTLQEELLKLQLDVVLFPEKQNERPHSVFSPLLETAPSDAVSTSTSLPLSFKEFPQEWQLNLGSSSALIKESFFEMNSEQQRIQSLWSPKNLKSKEILILRGQQFLDPEYITALFIKNLIAFPEYLNDVMPTQEQMIFSLLFNQPNMYGIARNLKYPDKGRVVGKYGFVLEVPAENIYFVSTMDSQLPPSDEYIKRVKLPEMDFKAVLFKKMLVETPEKMIEKSTHAMNNEVAFVPTIVIKDIEHKIKLAGFYVVSKPNWTNFKFFPPQFSSAETWPDLEKEARKNYEKQTVVSLDELKKIEAIAQKLNLPVYKLSD